MRWLNPLTWFRGPATPTAKRGITWDQAARAGLVGPDYSAGVPVSAETALGVSAVFCADRVISEDLASLPMLVYSGHRLDDGAKPLFEDRVSKLLARPNPEQTGPVFWSQFQHNANLWGFGLAEIEWDNAGRPVGLWPIPSPSARLDRVAGRLAFNVPGPDGDLVPLDPSDVLFVPGFSPDGSTGYRLLHTARMTLGMAVAAQRFGAARFRNGMNPAGAIKSPGLLSDQARENMRASWRALYGGADNAGVPMLLEDNTEWVKFETAHNDQLQLAQLMELLTTEVARFFNVSPVKLHQLGRATWGNLETLNRDHVVTTLGPWIAKRDAEVDAKLLGPGRHCRHIVDRLLTADTATRFTAWNSALAAGWMTPNEVRKREDMPPLPGGDDLHRPLNQAPAAATPPAETPPTEADADAGNPVPADAA